MTVFSLYLIYCLLLNVNLSLQVHAEPGFSPAAVPLAIRSPYLNSWFNTQNGSDTSNSWPAFWNGNTLGWIAYIRVDGTTYSLLGQKMFASLNVTPATVVGTEVTPTRTIQLLQAGDLDVTLTFLSPINPLDYVQQSFPFAYLAVNFTSVDRQPHEVQLYADISGQWLSGASYDVLLNDDSQKMAWLTVNTSDVIYHKAWLQSAPSTRFQEIGGQAIDGTVYHAMEMAPGRNVSWQTCQDMVCRPEFISTGGINSRDSNNTFRNVADDWPVLSISIDLGKVTSSPFPIVWTIGLVRDPSISYTLPSGQNAMLRPYYTTVYNVTEDALGAFVSNYSVSLNQAALLDEQVRQAASKVSPDGRLFDMLSLATRQVFSSLEITAPDQASGSAARAFMEDMGMSHRTSPVEKLFATLPMLLYYCPSMVELLLVPLLEQQDMSSQFLYAAPDLGNSFPNVSAPALNQHESIDQTANMLLIVLAHARYSNDTSLIHDYYNTLKGWAQWLARDNNTLYPEDQSSPSTTTSVVLSTNETNLSLKGIYAIKAMSEISQIVGMYSDSQQFGDTAVEYINTWQRLALSHSDDPYVVRTYGAPSSEWTLPVNLYIQTLFAFDLLNGTLLDKLTATYQTQLDASSSNGYQYGLPTDRSRNANGSLAGNAFMAASFTNDTARVQLIDILWKYASNNDTDGPLGNIFGVEAGQRIGETMSPALGALFAPLVRGVPPSGDPTPGSGSSRSRSVDVRVIAGVVIGAVIGSVVLAGLIWLWWRRRRFSPLLDFGEAKMEPTPFRTTSSFTPNLILATSAEKQQLWPSEQLPLLPQPDDGPSSTGGNSPAHVLSMVPVRSAANPDAERLRQDQLLGLRSEINDLRRIMLGGHVEVAPASSDLGAPPDYSS